MIATETTFFRQLGPDLYQVNAFRVAGLPVDADARVVRRRSEELKVMAKLGVGAATGRPPLPLDPPPDLDTVQEAMRRLRDPVRRIEDELFWFWPSHDSATEARDEALEALRRGDIAQAEQLWSNPRPGRPKAVAAHNLAVLAHARALDAGDLGTATDKLWKKALHHWQSVVADKAFWKLVSRRVRTADDPRLGPGAATELRRSLPVAVLSISARLAVQVALAGRRADARRHVGLMRGAGFAKTLVESALRDAARPELIRLRSRSQAARDRAEASPADGNEAADQLLDQAESVLAWLDAVLPARHPLVQGIRDEVAEHVRRCVVLYVNETSDWSEAEGLLEEAESTAAGSATKARIAQDLETVRDNLVYGTCWFCKEREADKEAAFEQAMYGDVNLEVIGYEYYNRQIQTTWRKGTVRVPRCAPCRDAHRGRGGKVWGIGCGGTVALLAAGIWLAISGRGVLGIILIVCAVAGCFVVPHLAGTNGLPNGQFATLDDFPPIKEQLAAGWSYGDKPSNVGG